MAKNRKDEVPGASRGRGLVIIFGILDVFCAAFLVISLIASPGGPVSASVPVETLPAFEENLDHYGAAADNSETYTSGTFIILRQPRRQRQLCPKRLPRQFRLQKIPHSYTQDFSFRTALRF